MYYLSINNTVMFLKFFVINLSPSRIHVLHTQILIEKNQFQNRNLADKKYSKNNKNTQANFENYIKKWSNKGFFLEFFKKCSLTFTRETLASL